MVSAAALAAALHWGAPGRALGEEQNGLQGELTELLLAPVEAISQLLHAP